MISYSVQDNKFYQIKGCCGRLEVKSPAQLQGFNFHCYDVMKQSFKRQLTISEVELISGSVRITP